MKAGESQSDAPVHGQDTTRCRQRHKRAVTHGADNRQESVSGQQKDPVDANIEAKNGQRTVQLPHPNASASVRTDCVKVERQKDGRGYEVGRGQTKDDEI